MTDTWKKGGRIGKAQAFLGSVLSFKPIITILHGGFTLWSVPASAGGRKDG